MVNGSDCQQIRGRGGLLFARTDNVGFSQIDRVFSEKNTLSADNIGFDNVGFSEKPTLSERNPYYLIR